MSNHADSYSERFTPRVHRVLEFARVEATHWDNCWARVSNIVGVIPVASVISMTLCLGLN